MLKRLSISAILIILLSQPAMAAGEPWKGKLQRTSPEQVELIEGMKRYVANAGPDALQKAVPLSDINWRADRGRRIVEPISNVTASGVKTLLNGNYFIHIDDPKTGAFGIRHFAKDGKYYSCSIKRGKTIKQNSNHHWAVRASLFGLSTFYFAPKNETIARIGWPLIFDNNSGILTGYSHSGSKWVDRPGWVQSKAPAFVETICPKMPITSINEAQTATDWNELQKQSTRRIKNINGVPFKNDYRDPVTAGMYYYHVPPQQ